MKARLKSCAVLAALLLAIPLALFSFVAPAGAATQLCGATDTVSVAGGEYIAQNNIWGADTPQCITVDGTSFTVDSAGHSNSTSGAPAAYPSLFKGCHWGQCTTGSGLPVQVDGDMPSVTTDWSTTLPGSGSYNAAYDLWYNTAPATTGAPDGAEMMIWLDYNGPVQPAGTRVASGVQISGATWDVWTTQMDWRYIAYVRTAGTASVDDLDLRAFTRDAVARDAVEEDWYLIDVEAGFEIWQGGQGLRTNAFSVDVGGTTDPPTDPPGDGRQCSATLRTDNSWNSGFTATVTVTNTGDEPLSGWTADWTFTGGQRVVNGWNATVTQSGADVRAVNANYNGAVPEGGSTSFGFQGSGPAPGQPAVTCTAG
ncbi:GH12 family glycosyl hydrolase domain-containing protein [Actinomadura livida]|uniref:Cellulose binding domain-containing protein n=1 Tax=Actinomadura livida TaxID=79909 RepID=A0A7W7MXW7_9ACTN|nr:MULTISPECIES: cellulose binding domain-containing protein [Actinomadura]MBB4774334.1 hypothetical protein [Actinomadura catellatispora]GGT83317.1 glycosyl hydrolase family 5 [Actinomadura livida]